MEQTLHRLIQPDTRIVDTAKGILDYAVTDPTPDSFKEVVIPDGGRFTNFKKNAPFVDSHDYSTIAKCVGKVIDFQVVGNQLIERVQWAIGIGNELADLGWNLTKAGFLRAVSIGFFPVQYLTPNSGKAWTDALANLNLAADADIRTIYTVWEQVELSACILGANPNALAKARSDGLILDSHLEKFPQLIRRMERSRDTAFSFPSTPSTKSTTSSKENLMNRLNILTGRSGVPTPKAAFDRLETIRRAGTDDEISRAAMQARIAVASERRNAGPDAIERFLNQPGCRDYFNALARYLKGFKVPKEQADYFKQCQVVMKDLGVVPGIGGQDGFLLAEGMSEQLFDLILIFGAYKTLGLRTLAANYRGC